MLNGFGDARIGRDAELRQTGSASVCNLALAFNVGFGDRKKTTWIEAALWGKQAEALAPYLLKGTQVCVALSEVSQETYTNNAGATQTKLVARLNDIQLIGKKEDGAPQQTAHPAARPAAPQPSRGFEDFKDDIPF